MKKYFLLTLALAVLLSACGTGQSGAAGRADTKPTTKNAVAAPLTMAITATSSSAGPSMVAAIVGKDANSKETQALVEKWITACQNRDAKTLLSLYSDDVVWSECSGDTCDRYGPAELKYYWSSNQGFGNPGFNIETLSYFVTDFGYKAVLQTLYSDPNTGSIRAPSVTILEIKNGKIASETWYSAPTP